MTLKKITELDEDFEFIITQKRAISKENTINTIFLSCFLPINIMTASFCNNSPIIATAIAIVSALAIIIRYVNSNRVIQLSEDSIAICEFLRERENLCIQKESENELETFKISASVFDELDNYSKETRTRKDFIVEDAIKQYLNKKPRIS